MNNVVTRALSGAAYVLLIIVSINSGSWLFMNLCLILAVFAMYEFQKMTLQGRQSRLLTNILDIYGALSLITMTTLACNGTISRDLAVTSLVPFLIYLIARLVEELYARCPDPVGALSRSFAGQLYIALPLTLLVVLYNVVATPHIVLAMFIFIWLNDTGAFCVGSLIGRRRLFERISPKKSWEGFWGGMAFCIVSAILMHTFFDNCFGHLSMAEMIFFAVVVSVFATWGDLVESLIKRAVNVKDSGNIMPGHGGILDRIDSLLLVAPATLCYFLFIMIFQ